LPRSFDPKSLGDACREEIRQGLAACQIAVACEGEVLFQESFGQATPTTRFWVASATKPLVASAVWLLLGEEKLELEEPVAHYIPEFAAHGKQVVTVEQILLMTCGLASAVMSSSDGVDPRRRVAQLARWRLEHEPGTQYVYHGGSAHWVLAELISRASGMDFRDFIETRITRPLGLPRLLGIARSEQEDIAQLSGRPGGGAEGRADYAAKFEAGEPGGGGVMRARDLALFYQALLHNPGGLWDADVLADATSNIRSTLPDPVMNLPANRTLGVVIGAGFGATWGKSATAFGWPGMGGQIGFAEPATGISFAFFQMGDLDPTRHFIRGIKMSNLALALGR